MVRDTRVPAAAPIRPDPLDRMTGCFVVLVTYVLHADEVVVRTSHNRKEEGRRLIYPTPSADAVTCRSIIAITCNLQRRPLTHSN